MVIVNLSRAGPSHMQATIAQDGVVHQLAFQVENSGGIRRYFLATPDRALARLIHNSGYARPFSYYFWKWNDGQEIGFPIDLVGGSHLPGAAAGS
jgi:hypothetical protein